MSLIRFDSTTDRGPTAQLWAGLVDWVSGSLATNLGQRDFEDFAPFLGPVITSDGREAGTHITALDTNPTSAHEGDRFGVVSVTCSAGTDEAVGLARDIFYDIGARDLTVIEARVNIVADANEVISCVGFTDQADPDDVFALGVINSAGTEDFIGIVWNDDETFDIVGVDAGTLTVFKNDIGNVAIDRSDGFAKIGLRIEKVTSTTHRLVPSINGTIVRSGIVNVLSSLLPLAGVDMRPVVANHVDTATQPDFDLDYIYSADK